MTDDKLELGQLSRILDAEIADLGNEISPIADALAELEQRLYMRMVMLRRLAEQQRVIEIHYAVVKSLRNLVRPPDSGVIRVPDR